MLNEYELAQQAADRARNPRHVEAVREAEADARLAPADPCATPAVDLEPDLKVVPVDTLKSIIARCEKAMQHIYLGDASLGLDDVYIDVAVAWAHARHALRGTRPTSGAPLSDLMLVERRPTEDAA